MALDLGERLDAVQSRHVVVEKHEIEFAARDLLERVDTFLRFGHIELEPAGHQDLAHDAAHGE